MCIRNNPRIRDANRDQKYQPGIAEVGGVIAKEVGVQLEGVIRVMNCTNSLPIYNDYDGTI